MVNSLTRLGSLLRQFTLQVWKVAEGQWGIGRYSPIRTRLE